MLCLWGQHTIVYLFRKTAIINDTWEPDSWPLVKSLDTYTSIYIDKKDSNYEYKNEHFSDILIYMSKLIVWHNDL